MILFVEDQSHLFTFGQHPVSELQGDFVLVTLRDSSIYISSTYELSLGRIPPLISYHLAAADMAKSLTGGQNSSVLFVFPKGQARSI